jgi:hypothetical protein
MKSQDDLEALANSKAFSLDVVDLDEKYDMKGLIGD